MPDQLIFVLIPLPIIIIIIIIINIIINLFKFDNKKFTSGKFITIVIKLINVNYEHSSVKTKQNLTSLCIQRGMNFRNKFSKKYES